MNKNSINNLITKQQELISEYHSICSFLAIETFPDEYMDMINRIESFLNEIENYDGVIKVKIPIYAGNYKERTLRLELFPSYKNALDSTKTITYLKATICKEHDLKQAWYVFDYSHQTENLFLTEKTGEIENCYIPLPTFIFIQLYERIDDIINEMKQQVIDNIKSNNLVLGTWISQARQLKKLNSVEKNGN